MLTGLTCAGLITATGKKLGWKGPKEFVRSKSLLRERTAEIGLLRTSQSSFDNSSTASELRTPYLGFVPLGQSLFGLVYFKDDFIRNYFTLRAVMEIRNLTAAPFL